MPTQKVADLACSPCSRLTDCHVKAWTAKVAEAKEKDTVPCCPDCDGVFIMRYGPHEEEGTSKGPTTLAPTV